MKRRATVVGVFNDHIAIIDAINDLRQLGFSDDQLGFVVRFDANRENATGNHDANAIAHGLISGLLGAADVLLLSTKRLDNASSLQKATPSPAEEAIDRLPHFSSHKSIPSRALPATTSSSEAPLLSEPDLGREASATTFESEKQNVPEKHGAGIITGGVIGGTLGAVASLQLPGIGPVVAGGILAAILANAEPGGIVGGFLSMGIPEQKAYYYEQQFQAGNIIFTIRANGEQQEACAILHHHGALSTEAH